MLKNIFLLYPNYSPKLNIYIYIYRFNSNASSSGGGGSNSSDNTSNRISAIILRRYILILLSIFYLNGSPDRDNDLMFSNSVCL